VLVLAVLSVFVVVTLFVSSLLVAVVVCLICLEDLQIEEQSKRLKLHLQTWRLENLYPSIYLSSCHCGKFNKAQSNPLLNCRNAQSIFPVFIFHISTARPRRRWVDVDVDVDESVRWGWGRLEKKPIWLHIYGWMSTLRLMPPRQPEQEQQPPIRALIEYHSKNAAPDFSISVRTSPATFVYSNKKYQSTPKSPKECINVAVRGMIVAGVGRIG